MLYIYDNAWQQYQNAVLQALIIVYVFFNYGCWHLLVNNLVATNYLAT